MKTTQSVFKATLVIFFSTSLITFGQGDPFRNVERIIGLHTWGEQKAQADRIAVNRYEDEYSGVYFGHLFGQRSKQQDYDSNRDHEYIHTMHLPDGSSMSWWQDATYSWGTTERDYNYRVTGDGGTTIYYHYWDTTYRVFSDYSRSGTTPPDPMPSNFKVTVTCRISDIEYAENHGLATTQRFGEEKHFYRLSALTDDYTDTDILDYGEQMDSANTSGLWRRYWARCKPKAADLALIMDNTAKLRAETKGIPCEQVEKIGQD